MVVLSFFLIPNNLTDEENLEHLRTSVVHVRNDADGASLLTTSVTMRPML